LLHKTDIGGVVVDIKSRAEAESTLVRFTRLAKRKGLRFDGMLVQEMVRDGVELILGETRDPTFGPVLAVGLGGTYTELLRDYALAVAPVTEREAKRMIEQTRLGEILGGYRGGPRVGIGSLCRVISSFSKILAENPAIEQMEVNPLICTTSGVLAVDARVVLDEKRTLPRSHDVG
jgi:acyl-CoA synthetase (NDP forming)